MQLGKKRKRKMPDEAMEIGYLADLFYQHSNTFVPWISLASAILLCQSYYIGTYTLPNS
jgi:hypothetical protein